MLTEINDLALQKIFDSINSRVWNFEKSDLEFKENFTWGSRYEYLKTLVAFSNAHGGYLIFGVKDEEGVLVGLAEHSLSKFNEKDNHEWTTLLRSHFHKEINWDRRVYEYDGKRFGVVYACEIESKPVICTNDAHDQLRKSSIYYRYNSQTTVIEPGDLITLLEQEKLKYAEHLLKKASLVLQAGVDDALVLDLKSGNIDGGKINGCNIYIDSDSLEKIKFIQKGHFTEDKGAPALVLKGEIDAIKPAISQPIAKKEVAISPDDVISRFLKQESVETPYEYLKFICNSTSPYYPIYYYIKLMNYSLDEVISEINNIPNNSSIKEKIIKRIDAFKKGEYLQYQLPTNKIRGKRKGLPPASITKRKYVKQLLDNNPTVPTDDKNIRYYLQAMQSLNSDDVINKKDYLLERLSEIYSHQNESNTRISTDFRKALCWIDEALYINLQEN